MRDEGASENPRMAAGLAANKDIFAFIEAFQGEVEYARMQTENGYIRVWGRCRSLAAKERVIQLLSALPGITKVYCELSVSELNIGEKLNEDAVYKCKVGEGESLTDLAYRIYGSVLKWEEIVYENAEAIADPLNPDSGMSLRLPA